MLIVPPPDDPPFIVFVDRFFVPLALIIPLFSYSFEYIINNPPVPEDPA